MEREFQQLKNLGHTKFESLIPQSSIELFEKTVVELYGLQASKIGDFRDEALETLNSKETNFEKFCNLYELLEKDDKDALYQVQKFLPASNGARNIFTDKVMEICAQALGSDTRKLLIDGPAVFINRPNTERLLYRWHSEVHYYPKRRRFLNLWLPLFTPKTKQNGTMSFKEQSHKNSYPFVEYQGYSAKSEKKNSFIQMEIPPNFLAHLNEHWVEANVGDLVMFDKNLAHTSNANTSNQYSAAIVARVWDPSDDLTLSGNVDATPYGGNLGRQNLIVSSEL
jgi:hypothetical protein